MAFDPQTGKQEFSFSAFKKSQTSESENTSYRIKDPTAKSVHHKVNFYFLPDDIVNLKQVRMRRNIFGPHTVSWGG